MSGHTPGPWRVDIDRAIVADSRARGIWRTVVADLQLPDGPNGPQEREANAHLIAAAPDLLAALEEIAAGAPTVEPLGPTLTSSLTDWATRTEHYRLAQIARAAIAKAKGEPP